MRYVRGNPGDKVLLKDGRTAKIVASWWRKPHGRKSVPRLLVEFPDGQAVLVGPSLVKKITPCTD